MFSGVTTLNLDNKGRLAIPSRYREALAAACEGKLVVTADPTGCLLVYPEPEWLPIARKLGGLSAFNPQVRQYQRMLIGFAEPQEIDSAGRITVLPALRKHAQLEKEVVLVGQGNKFELWDQARWDATVADIAPLSADAMPADLEGFSL
jgi:MraZ protein